MVMFIPVHAYPVGLFESVFAAVVSVCLTLLLLRTVSLLLINGKCADIILYILA